jgi:TRAP transporter TAXI family solute receptor
MLAKRIIMGICVLTLLAFFHAPSASAGKPLTIATDPLGSGTYGCTAGLAGVINKHTDISIKVRSTNGALEVGPTLARREVELGILSSYEAMMAYRTEGQYDKPLQGMSKAPFRVLMGGPPTFVSVVVREDAGIKTGKDLVGKRFVGVFMGCEACTLQGAAFLANWGLSKKDVIMIRTPGLGSAIDLLIEGKADAAGTGAPGMAALRELEAKRGARFLSLNPDPKAILAYQKIFPGSIKQIKPAPDLAGVKQPIHMAAFEDLLIANKDLVSDETAYKLVKTLWDKNKELRKAHVNLQYVTHKAMVTEGSPMPFHPGAIKFYKETGVWSKWHEDKNRELLKKEKN